MVRKSFDIIDKFLVIFAIQTYIYIYICPCHVQDSSQSLNPLHRDGTVRAFIKFMGVWVFYACK